MNVWTRTGEIQYIYISATQCRAASAAAFHFDSLICPNMRLRVRVCQRFQRQYQFTVKANCDTHCGRPYRALNNWFIRCPHPVPKPAGRVQSKAAVVDGGALSLTSGACCSMCYHPTINPSIHTVSAVRSIIRTKTRQ